VVSELDPITLMELTCPIKPLIDKRKQQTTKILFIKIV
jgi:hypothetical protein